MTMAESKMNIAKDTFLDTKAYENYEKFKLESKVIHKAISEKKILSDVQIDDFIALNPDFWEVYFKAGKYYQQQKNYAKAIANFEKALTKEITTLPDEKEVRKQLNKVKRKYDF